MSGGGGETTTQNTIPEYLQNAHQNVLQTGAAVANQPYVAYTQPRIANWSADQTAAQTAIRNQAGTGANFTANGFGHGVASDVAGYDPTMVQAAQIDRGDVRNVAAQGFNGATIQNYMNPYISGVVDTTNQELLRQNNILQNQTNAQAAAAGAFGGSRQAIMNAENNRNYMDKVASTTANLYNTGYNTATGLQQSDANRTLQADLSNQGMDWNVSNQNAQLQQQAALANQAAGLQGQNLKLSAAGQMMNSANARNNALMNQQQYNMNNANALNQSGAQQQAFTQSNLDLAYQDFLNQRGYPMSQLQGMQGLLQGPYSTSSTSTQKTDNTGQLVGTGLMAAATFF